MKIGGKILENRTYIMGILNITPDSFSDGGKFNTLDRALKRAEEMILEGADILDIGGESTRPGYTKITDQEEIERTAPVIEAIRARLDIPISIDTYKSAVADAALSAGAVLVNDIWGFRYDPKIAGITKKHDASCCLMHNRKADRLPYTNYFEDVLSDLKVSIQTAQAAGISRDRIMTDPGLGFAKTYDENLSLMNHLEFLHKLNLPVLLGASRKSMIGLTLNLPFDQRLEGTLATTVLAVIKNCLFVRVHDVAANKRAILMTEKIIGRW